VPDEQQDLAEVRLDKLRQIEALGIDPWGHRFDDATPIGTVRQLPAEPFNDATPGPSVRAAGRVVRYRTGGKLLFLEIWDQTGRVQLMISTRGLTTTTSAISGSVIWNVVMSNGMSRGRDRPETMLRRSAAACGAPIAVPAGGFCCACTARTDGAPSTSIQATTAVASRIECVLISPVIGNMV
jgi:hypothetical protein